jgi:thiamine biosynthesis protein ThiI
MLRVAEAVAKKEGADALLTGESLGQVASQTLKNLRVEEDAVNIPILRPLIGLDKVEIEGVAKQIGTYDTSIMPGSCCTTIPDKPATQAKLDSVLEAEGKLRIEELVENSIKGAEVIGE